MSKLPCVVLFQIFSSLSFNKRKVVKMQLIQCEK